MKTIRIPSKINRDDLALFFWSVAIFSYFVQFPFYFFSYLIIPNIALFLALKLSEGMDKRVSIKWKIFFLLFFMYLMVMAVVSVIHKTPIVNIFRFFLILSTIPLFSSLKYQNRFRRETNVFIFLAVIKCLSLLFLALLVIVLGTYGPLRQWASSYGIGDDIYIDPGTHLVRVQVHGNGILPMAYLLHLYLPKRNERKWRWETAILLLGVITAGNAAFIMALGMYYFVKMVKYIFLVDASLWRKAVCLLALLLATAVGIYYIISQLSLKAVYSNVKRALQLRVLLETNLLFGSGLGNYIESFEGAIYYELQTLYIFNQIGLVGLTAFFALIFSRFVGRGKTATFLFLIYLVYSFWNPYCFDTTEMIVLALIFGNRLHKKLSPREQALLLLTRMRLTAKPVNI